MEETKPTFAIAFTEEELSAIIQSLQEAPFKVSAPIINKIVETHKKLNTPAPVEDPSVDKTL